MKKNLFITGTLWLTGAGLISRLLGFFYRIYLSNLVGAEGMGLYQLLTPIYFLIFTLCTSGIQSALSRLVAEHYASRRYRTMLRLVFWGVLPAILLSLFCSALLFVNAEWVGSSFLGDPRTIPGLRILCLSLPFCAVSACCKSYFHGIRQMSVPATEQVFEQLVRIGIILWLAPYFAEWDLSRICLGLMAATAGGDIASCLYVFVFYYFSRKKHLAEARDSVLAHQAVSLLLIALPITGSRVLTQFLSCFENIMLPRALELYGYSRSQALELLGIFSGMVLPILLFPSVLTGSVSANLLPLASQAHATGNYRRIHRCIDQVLRFTFLLSFLCTTLLSVFGQALGELLYDEPLAGTMLMFLSLFCPFIYLQGTLTGLLHGLGLQNSTFLYQLIGGALVVLSILLLVPRYGLMAFLGGYLVSLLLTTFLNLHRLLRVFSHRPPLLRFFVLPMLACTATALTLHTILRFFSLTPVKTVLLAVLGTLFYLGASLLSGAIQKKDLSQVLSLFANHR